MSVELRPCRQGWVFCDGNCEKCITITTSTTTTNPEKIENCGTKRGRWKGAGMGDYMCSLCNMVVSGNRYHYCPNCGARMDETVETYTINAGEV